MKKSIVLILLLAIVGSAGAVPTTPVYTTTFYDAITGDNAFLSGGYRYWDIDPGADSYQNEFYERPTVQSYGAVGSKYAASEYFENLDIVSGKVGFDSEFIYFAIELYGLDKSTSDGVDTPEGLIYEYGVRFSPDPDGRYGYLLRATQPNERIGTFGTDKNLGFYDSDGDVGGRGIYNGGATGLSVTKTDNSLEEVGMNGYDPGVISGGTIDPANIVPVLYSRIDPCDPQIVEIAFAYQDFGLAADYPLSIQYLDFQAIKGDPMDPQKYFWNDKFTDEEAGSPYPGVNYLIDGKSEFGPQGLVSVYELDTLRGGYIIPAPSAVFLGGIGVVLVGWLRRRKTL